MPEANPYRLPRAVLPRHYVLEITPDLAAASFVGEAHITVTVTEPVTEIRLNAAELDITSAVLRGTDGSAIVATVALDAEFEVATLTLADPAPAGEWTLDLRFAGILNDKLHGFYRSTFTGTDGVEHVIATTQFEATDARRAFPCWDEPDFKAVFAVTLVIDSGLVALSNAAVAAETELAGGKRRIEFADTMIMSTYLVAFVVGPFVLTEPVDVDGIGLRVACVPGKQALTPFALEVGAAALRYFTSYFGIGYPGGKLDLIAIPDFAFGAMENLGCVTFRETALLVDPERASRMEIERVTDVVGHEIAHMWFGDLVTMKWWNGIWLNEAFATFMEMLLTDNFRPQWQRWATFGLSKSAAMAIDSLSSTRPIEFEVIEPAEAQGMFDLLTYEKGAGVLRMLEQHLGAQTFKAGIAAYLSTHSYGNAETTDLWDALEGSSGEQVRDIMDSWILQAGHPIVRAELSADGASLTLTQRKFRYLPHEEQTLWQIPIGIRSGAAAGTELAGTGLAGAQLTEPVLTKTVLTKTVLTKTVLTKTVLTKTVLAARSDTIAVPANSWLVANAGANGFYRVSYDETLLARLTANLSELDPLERFGLVTDTWALCLGGETSLADVLTVLAAVAEDDDPDVWRAALAPLALLDRVVPDDGRTHFRRFVSALVAAKFRQLGWSKQPDESERISTLRGVFISALGTLAEDPDVQREAAARYADYLAAPHSLDADLVRPVESVLAATNEVRFYDQLYAKFSAEDSTPQAKVSALEALASFTAPELVDRTLALVSAGEVRSQDAPYAIRIMLGQQASGPAVWQWCEQHWDELMTRLPQNSIDRMIAGVTAHADPEFADRVTAFLAEHPVRQARKSIDQTCERLLVNARFYRANRDSVTALLAAANG